MFCSHQGVSQPIGALQVELVRLCTRVIRYHSTPYVVVDCANFLFPSATDLWWYIELYQPALCQCGSRCRCSSCERSQRYITDHSQGVKRYSIGISNCWASFPRTKNLVLDVVSLRREVIYSALGGELRCRLTRKQQKYEGRGGSLRHVIQTPLRPRENCQAVDPKCSSETQSDWRYEVPKIRGWGSASSAVTGSLGPGNKNLF